MKSSMESDLSSAVKRNEKVVKSEDQWKAILTPEQYSICRNRETERAFAGAYYHNE